jgi:hypothetical protein
MSSPEEVDPVESVVDAVAQDPDAAIVPLLAPASGLYEWRLKLVPQPIPVPIPIPQPIPQPIPGPSPFGVRAPDLGAGGQDLDEAALAAALPLPLLPLRREELRLDVDGRYPQMAASGTFFAGVTLRVHWIARLVPIAANRWRGAIWYKDGTAAALPHTQVTITAVRSPFPNQRRATVVFSGGGSPPRTVTYTWKTAAFHAVAFEFDRAQGTTPVTTVQTNAHPNRPAGLPSETLSIETVFRRAGFSVTTSGSSQVPLALANANARWSDAEMHDAMQVHWSRFANQAQWAMWTFFASLHEMGTSLGGIMFDDIGPQHRQGTAIFEDSFIKNPPAGDPAPAAWVQRMRFWTAVHEMGHSFNLAHSWQKSLGTPWIPLANEPEARSFMNYPYNVAGGQASFFATFAYRFSDPELLFLRHAPSRFVEMGNAAWFDHHGFELPDAEAPASLRLQVRVNRERAAFEFLEPIVIELKLTNVSDRIQVVDEDAVEGGHGTVVVLKKHGSPARQWAPFACYLRQHREVALKPGESIYGSLFVSAGLNGWDIADPGRYVVQVAIRSEQGEIVSEACALRILPPRSHDEERIAQDLFSDGVGRALAFDGTRFFEGANDTLREAADRFKDLRVACHARVALAVPATLAYKELDLDGKAPAIRVQKAKTREAGDLREALVGDANEAAETLGHVDYKYYVDRCTDYLVDQGDSAVAAQCQTALHRALAARKVLPRVLAAIQDRIARLQGAKKGRGKAAEAEGEGEGEGES